MASPLLGLDGDEALLDAMMGPGGSTMGGGSMEAADASDDDVDVTAGVLAFAKGTNTNVSGASAEQRRRSDSFGSENLGWEFVEDSDDDFDDNDNTRDNTVFTSLRLPGCTQGVERFYTVSYVYMHYTNA